MKADTELPEVFSRDGSILLLLVINESYSNVLS